MPEYEGMTPLEYRNKLRTEFGITGKDLDYIMEICKMFKGTLIRIYD